MGARPELVITDMTMPELSGIELARRVAALRTDLPVVLATGNPAGVREDELHRWDIRGLMLKPATVRELARAAHAALQAKSE